MYPVQVPYPPILFVGSTGTYAVGGVWIRVPDGTKREDLHLYAVCEPSYTVNTDKIRHFTAIGSKGDTYKITDHNGQWSCTCHGFTYNRKCKHIESFKNPDQNVAPKKATKYCSNPVQLSMQNGIMNSRGNKKQLPASIKEKKTMSDVNNSLENIVNTNNDVVEDAVDMEIPESVTEILPVLDSSGKQLTRPVVTEINPETLAVTLTLPGGREVQAAPFRWGRKMLMKVDGTDLERGARVSIGQIAKKALTAAGLVLPPAELKRPRKPKAEEVTKILATLNDAEVDGAVITLAEVTLPEAVNTTPPEAVDNLNDQLDDLLRSDVV